MLKLLSRSKHEEFESNSALQIRDQKERREENTRKLEHLRNWFLQHCSFLPALFLYAALFLLASRSFFLRYALFAFVFDFFPFYPCNSLPILIFFCNFPYTEHLYKPQSVKTLCQSPFARRQYSDGRQFRHCFLFSFSFILFSIFSAAKHPLMMINQRMFD